MLRDIGTVAAEAGLMPDQPIKFYQAGSFAVGNRLLDPEQRTVQADARALERAHLRPPRLPGLRRGARRPLRARRRDARDAAAGWSPPTRPAAWRSSRRRIPESSWQLPWLHSLFGNAPAVATGDRRRAEGQGPRPTCACVGQGGDGGTVDIGFGCLSGMFERNDDVLFVCYDNEGYMNTGVQRSGATPPAARTATTAGGRRRARQRRSARARARR